MSKTNEFIKRIIYSMGANLLSLAVSVITTLLVPKFFGAEISQYGYMQIYMFYVSYIGFFHFGLCDGIYLRDGGKRYEDLDKPLYSSLFRILTGFSAIILAVLLAVGFFAVKDREYRFIFCMTGVNVLIFLPRTMLQYNLQTTNRIKEYAAITTTGRAVYGAELVLIFLFCKPDYRIIVIADTLAKALALTAAVMYCRDIVFAKPCDLKTGLCECSKNISVGIKLLFANVAGMLITGIVRWGIEQKWDVTTYGKIAFSLSISQFLLVFINAVALVLYPALRQTEKEKLPVIYRKVRDILMVPLFGCIILYYPFKVILSRYLPRYAESIQYMAILFPLCIFSAKMSLLVQTYLNVFRMERQMLIVNIFGVGAACVTTVISVFILENLALAMFSVVLNRMIRCVLAEHVLTKRMGIDVKRDNLSEILLTGVFIISNWFIGGGRGIAIYTAAYISYCLLEKEKISMALKTVFADK